VNASLAARLALVLSLAASQALAQNTAGDPPPSTDPPAATDPPATTDPPAATEDPPAAEAPAAQGATPARGAAATTAPTLTDEARARLGATAGDVTEWPDSERLTHRTLVPPFVLLERSPNRRTTVVFPFLWRERRGEDTQLLVPPYYQRRSPTLNVDVVFPLLFHWRGQLEGTPGATFGTDVVPPFYYHSWRGRGELRGLAVGLAPLFFYGESFGQDGSLLREHLIIPPLLTVHTWRPEHAFTLAGPFYYNRRRADTDWGLAPLWFAGNNPRGNYLVIPALLTYHAENRLENTATTVVGPFWTTQGPQRLSVNLAPLFFHGHDATSSHTTVFPLFHHDRGPEGFTLVTPLFGYSRRENSRTFISWLYQQHRGETNWDAVAPFFYSSRTPATGAHTEAFFPLFYHRYTPQTNSWWVLPTAHYERTGNDWFFNFYPIVFAGRSGRSRHTVVAPLYWDFENEETGSRTTIFAPVFWRFATQSSVTMLAGNVLWMSAIRQGVRSYEWHVLPIFSYARPRPEDVSWNVLFGLAGYRRSGTHRQIRVFWIPITL
jgi:hypothetical protein